MNVNRRVLSSIPVPGTVYLGGVLWGQLVINHELVTSHGREWERWSVLGVAAGEGKRRFQLNNGSACSEAEARAWLAEQPPDRASDRAREVAYAREQCRQRGPRDPHFAYWRNEARRFGDDLSDPFWQALGEPQAPPPTQVCARCGETDVAANVFCVLSDHGEGDHDWLDIEEPQDPAFLQKLAEHWEQGAAER
jgi:hypothetical protein